MDRRMGLKQGIVILGQRAERLFADLIETDAHPPSALRSLLEIYQQEKDWDKALEQAQPFWSGGDPGDEPGRHGDRHEPFGGAFDPGGDRDGQEIQHRTVGRFHQRPPRSSALFER